jgi:acetate kinase
MAFTPAAGIPMSSRSGDLDPGLAAWLAHSEDMSPAAFQEMVNKHSGLLGLSETSPDMRDLLEREAHDPRAADAVAVFCYEAKKRLGAYAAALGGLDTLVFSGGIGAHSAAVRARICAGLEFLGIEIDPQRNAAGAALVSRSDRPVAVRIMQTDEELQIARHVQRCTALGR